MRILMIQPGCSLALAALACEREHMEVILLDDMAERHERIQDNALRCLTIQMPLATAVSDWPVMEKGPRRAQNQQPFYRGLKKYRKP